MADTKIRTDRLSVSSLVKSILDATTAGAIQTLLNLVPGVNVQGYDANILTTTNTKTVTNKTINPYSVGMICDSAGTNYGILTAYDHTQFSVGANIGIKGAANRYGNQFFRLILAPYGGDRTITWDSSIIAASGVTLPTTLISGKLSVVFLHYLRFSDPTYYWLATSVATEP